MKVKELIKDLQECDPEATVVIYLQEDCGFLVNVLHNGDNLYFKGDPPEMFRKPPFIFLAD